MPQATFLAQSTFLLAYLAAWAGWLVDYQQPVYLLTPHEDLAEAVRVLRKIGIDRIGGHFAAEEANAAGLLSQSYEQLPPEDLAISVENEEVILIDVRGDSEWNESHIAKAKRCFLAYLPETLAQFDGPCTLVFHCQSGARSGIAVSLAQAAGIEKVVNMVGGINAWKQAGFKTKSCKANCGGPTQFASENEFAGQNQAIYWNATCPAPTPNA